MIKGVCKNSKTNQKGARMEENRQLAVVMRWFDDSRALRRRSPVREEEKREYGKSVEKMMLFQKLGWFSGLDILHLRL